MPNNLWGDLPAAESLRTPLHMLKEQASILTKLTNGVLEGHVSTTRSGRKLDHTLAIIAPALQGYVYLVVTVNHDIAIYPIRIHDDVEGRTFEVKDEAGFTQVIGDILSSQKVKSVIAGLLAQSTSAAE